MQSIIGPVRRPGITFHADGRIEITARVASILALAKGDSINVGTIADEYLLYVRHRAAPATPAAYEATVYPTRPRVRNFRAWSARLCRAVIRLCADDADSAGSPASVSPQLGASRHHHLYGTVIPIIVTTH